jgi:hypothetical protein
MNINQFLSMTIAHDPNNWPEIECHTLDSDEFVTHKIEDENDLGFVCRNHEVYLEDGPDIHGTTDAIVDRIKNYTWMVNFWDRADALIHHTRMSADDIWEDANARAERSVAELEAY